MTHTATTPSTALCARDRNGHRVDAASAVVPLRNHERLYLEPESAEGGPTHVLVPIDEYRRLRDLEALDRIDDSLDAGDGSTFHELAIGVGAIPGARSEDEIDALAARLDAEFAGEPL